MPTTPYSAGPTKRPKSRSPPQQRRHHQRLSRRWSLLVYLTQWSHLCSLLHSRKTPTQTTLQALLIAALERFSQPLFLQFLCKKPNSLRATAATQPPSTKETSRRPTTMLPSSLPPSPTLSLLLPFPPSIQVFRSYQIVLSAANTSSNLDTDTCIRLVSRFEEVFAADKALL